MSKQVNELTSNRKNLERDTGTERQGLRDRDRYRDRDRQTETDIQRKTYSRDRDRDSICSE